MNVSRRMLPLVIALALYSQAPILANDFQDPGSAVDSSQGEALGSTSATPDTSPGFVNVTSARPNTSTTPISVPAAGTAGAPGAKGVDNNIHHGQIAQTMNPMMQPAATMQSATNPMMQPTLQPMQSATNPMMLQPMQSLQSDYNPNGMPINTMRNSGWYNNSVTPSAAGMYPHPPGMFCPYGNMSQHANMCQHPVICGGATMCNGNHMMMAPMQCNGMHGNTQMQSSNNGQINTQMVGAIGTAVMLGSFLQNGGIGGMLRSVGWDNHRYIRGPMAGY